MPKAPSRRRSEKKFESDLHVSLLAAGAPWFLPALLAPLAVLLVRAVWSPHTKITAKQSGMLEIAYSIMIAGFALADLAVGRACGFGGRQPLGLAASRTHESGAAPARRISHSRSTAA